MKTVEIEKKGHKFIIRISDDAKMYISIDGHKEEEINGAAKTKEHGWAYVLNGTILNKKMGVNQIMLRHSTAEEMWKYHGNLRGKIKDEENAKNYAPLVEKLPEIPKFGSTPNKEKFEAAMSKISHSHFSGPEDDGLNLHIEASNRKARAEAQNYCDHKLETSYIYGYTADARYRLTRVIECKKCGLIHTDSVEEELSPEAIWN